MGHTPELGILLTQGLKFTYDSRISAFYENKYTKIVSEKSIEIEKAICPTCSSERNCFVQGSFKTSWEAAGGLVDGSTTYCILRCCGCDTAFFRSTEYHSESVIYGYDRISGEEYKQADLDIKYWPSPITRERPEWLLLIESFNRNLYSIVDQVYRAVDNNILTLAAIGVRTAIECSAEAFEINTNQSFQGILTDLQKDGRIGESEKDLLVTVVEAGNAAAHRGWSPEMEQFDVLMSALEQFLHRNIVLQDKAGAIRSGVPKRAGKEKRQ